jgi:YesN/AraC family two-component response regulator
MREVKNVLILDDEEMICSILSRVIKKLFVNVSILTLSNGQEAFNLETELIIFDLIITDMDMPIMNGCEFISNYNEIEFKGDKPKAHVLIFSGSSNLSQVFNCQSQYPQLKIDYLAKPSNLKELKTVITSLLSKE